MPGLIMRSPVIISSSPRRTSSEPTNTLIITSLPPTFFHPSVLNPLRAHFESYGELYTWAPLRAFARIIVVFWEVADAERLRQDCDNLIVGHDEASVIYVYFTHIFLTDDDSSSSRSMRTLRIYRGDMTPIYTSADFIDNHLQVPAQPKNFLISPPGSPPIGWEPVREDPPNAAALASDLVAALTRLQLQQGPRRTSDGKQVLMSPDNTDDVSQGKGLLVLLEDTDEPWSDGQRTPEEIVEILDAAHEESSARRRNPYGSIGNVKATVTSMMSTAMPPLRTSMPTRG